MGYLYISYSRQNAEFAQRLVNELETRGYTTWVDTDDLATGDVWAKQIAQAIREAEVFITLLSPATAANRTVHREIELAEAARKPIIPVLVESAPIPPSLVNRQLVDATGDWNVFIAELIRAIDASAASVPMRKVRVSAAAAPTPPAGIPAAVPPASRRAGIGRPLLLIGLLGLLGLIAAALVVLAIQTSSVPTANGVPATMTLAPTGTALAIAPTASPADQIEAAQMTATALIARATQQAAGIFTQAAIAPSDAGDDRLEAEIAMRVDATIAAINTAEASGFPTAAAQVLAVSSTTNTLAYLTGILAALALGVSIAALVVIRSYNNRPLPRRTAHSTAHHGSSPAHPEATPPEKMLEDYQIFTSSSDKDKDWVRIVVEDLEALGYSVWWYAKDAPGLPFGNEIRSAIYHTKVFMIVVSPDSMRSKHVEEEVRWAEIYDRPIVPVLCRPTSIEERLYGLAKGADIDFTHDYKAALEFLAQAIDHYLAQRLEKMQVLPDSSSGTSAGV
jgi:hypothetical protein